eukprot:GHVU01007338.1.p1 GENE.GHVU01007338.1~~GHVU01007338.1.p1  ORF type:complete len:264 (-),score=0.41 GHVU01007338.1:680-1471(-)
METRNDVPQTRDFVAGVECPICCQAIRGNQVRRAPLCNNVRCRAWFHSTCIRVYTYSHGGGVCPLYRVQYSGQYEPVPPPRTVRPMHIALDGDSSGEDEQDTVWLRESIDGAYMPQRLSLPDVNASRMTLRSRRSVVSPVVLIVVREGDRNGVESRRETPASPASSSTSSAGPVHGGTDTSASRSAARANKGSAPDDENERSIVWKAFEKDNPCTCTKSCAPGSPHSLCVAVERFPGYTSEGKCGCPTVLRANTSNKWQHLRR